MSTDKEAMAEETPKEISQAEQYKNEANEYFKSVYRRVLSIFIHIIVSCFSFIDFELETQCQFNKN